MLRCFLGGSGSLVLRGATRTLTCQEVRFATGTGGSVGSALALWASRCVPGTLVPGLGFVLGRLAWLGSVALLAFVARRFSALVCRFIGFGVSLVAAVAVSWVTFRPWFGVSHVFVLAPAAQERCSRGE